MRLTDLENKHAGKMAFILGAGPSLHFQDVERLKYYVTFGVNSGILKMPDCDYFISDDIAAREWNYYKIVAAKSKCTKLLFEGKLRDEAGHFREEEVVWYDHVPEHNPDFDVSNPGGYEIKCDASEPIIGARTSSGSAVHLSYSMGCDPIVLLGCDSCYRHGLRYFWQFPGEQRAIRLTSSKPAFCLANRGNLNGKPVDQHCCDFNDYWKRLREVNPNVNIIYASEGGLIDAFPSMTLKEVLKKYGDRSK